jgi:hypothetical protein
MFKAGRKYKNKLHKGIIEVLYVGKTRAFVRVLSGDYHSVGTEYSTSLAVDPSRNWVDADNVSGRFFVSMDGNSLSLIASSNAPPGNYLGEIHIAYEDGKLSVKT